MRLAILGLLSASLSSRTALGQSQEAFHRSLGGSLGVIHTQAEGTGMSLTGAYSLANQFVALNLVPVDLGVMPQDPNGRFRSETTSSGNTVCRDHSNGQFADASNCGPRFIYAASVDAVGALSVGNQRSAAIGLGYRAGNSAGVYGVGTFVFGPMSGSNWRLSLRVGSSFFDLGIGGSVPLK